MDFAAPAPEAVIKKTSDNLPSRNIIPHVVPDRAAALALVTALIPAGASVQNGSSRTLEEIGFVDYLKAGEHGWNNLHAGILAEKEPLKQMALRKEATLSDFYLGSVHAITEGGELYIASNTGSQLPNIVFNSPNLIFVVGAQKIVPDRAAAFDRIEKHVVPLEDENMQQKYGIHTNWAKTVVFTNEFAMSGRKVHVVLVGEKLGF